MVRDEKREKEKAAEARYCEQVGEGHQDK